jgi:hypothetical protein
MKIVSALVVAAVMLAAPATFAADHASMPGMDGGEHMQHMGDVVAEEVIDGVKVTFRVMDMAAHMKSMQQTLPKGVKETHHIAVEFTDPVTAKPITSGEVRVKVVGPDKSEQVKNLLAMDGHFGADFILAAKGKYGVMAKFKLPDGKVRQARFWYEVK